MWSRHTHIDIDGRNAIYTTHLYGRKEAGGRVEGVNTFSQFDAEVTKSYRTDKFYIKRMLGVLNVKTSWNKWLGYTRFGPARSSSTEAQAQGGRQEDPMCLRFFLGRLPGNEGKALMKYKFRETDRYWVPYSTEGITCLSSAAPSTVLGLLKHPGIRDPKPWTESSALRTFFANSAKLSAEEKHEWSSFFDSVPASVDDYSEDQLFPWRLPELVQAFKQARMATTTSENDDSDTPRPIKLDERVLHPAFTASDARKEARARAVNFEREKKARMASKESEQLSQTQSQPTARSGRSQTRQHEGIDDSMIAGASAVIKIALGKAGVVSVGDNIVVSPDQKSRQGDLKQGYKLGLNIGEVLAVNVKKKQVQVRWFYSVQEHWTTKTMFTPWRFKTTNEEYKEWLDIECLLVDTWGSLVKLELVWVKGTKGFGLYKLTKDSVNLVLEVIKADEDDDGDDNRQ